MIRILPYPNCYRSFIRFCNKDKNLSNKYKDKLSKVSPFDVTLRDGLQGLTVEQQNKMTSYEKINLYYYIKNKYEPINMEIGSIVSNKILPIFEDSSIIYNHIENNYHETNILNPNEQRINNFILISNENQFLLNKNKFIGLNSFSFIASVSESFQQKNTKMSLSSCFKEINNMMRYLDDLPEKHTTKLYISCINECPIEGKIDNDIIIDKILKYQELKPDILCLSDTCGSLTVNDLKYILTKLDIISPSRYNLKNISLHLHVKPGRETEVEQIIHTALDFGITSFDVSALETGGCSVTMDKSELAPNLSYELYYKSLVTYLLK